MTRDSLPTDNGASRPGWVAAWKIRQPAWSGTQIAASHRKQL